MKASELKSKQYKLTLYKALGDIADLLCREENSCITCNFRYMDTCLYDIIMSCKHDEDLISKRVELDED